MKYKWPGCWLPLLLLLLVELVVLYFISLFIACLFRGLKWILFLSLIIFFCFVFKFQLNHFSLSNRFLIALSILAYNVINCSTNYYLNYYVALDDSPINDFIMALALKQTTFIKMQVN